MGFSGAGSGGSGRYLCPPTQYSPASATALQTTSATMVAVSSANVNTGSFTAPVSGNVVVTASFCADNSAATHSTFGLALHGTTTIVGNMFTMTCPNVSQIFTIVFLVTGLTAGNTYNLDLMYAVVAAGTLELTAFGQSTASPTGTPGGPVIMTVQAV